MTLPSDPSVIVVGAGLAGLAASIRLARSGFRVRLLERRASPGGLAATENHEGYLLNRGPHALYRGGAAMRELRELGVRPRGKLAAGQNGYLLLGEQLVRGPFGATGLIRTSALSRRAKWELVKRIVGLERERIEAGTTMKEWLKTSFVHDDARAVMETLVRLTTYSHDPSRLCARSGVTQLVHGMRGVEYLDGGWQQLVDGLSEHLEEAGVEVETEVAVRGLLYDGGRVVGLRTKTAAVRASAVLVTSGAQAIRPWLEEVPEGSEVSRFIDACRPARAECLDVALTRLPRAMVAGGGCDLILGVDEPVYASVHTAHADLAPEGGAVVHVARYLGPEEEGCGRARLEEVLELMQPGYAEHVKVTRYRPHLRVTTDIPVAGVGTIGRPSVRVAPGLYVAGDWVGAEGMLADAVFASARAAFEAIDTDMKQRAAA